MQNLFELDSLLFEEYEIRLDSIESASLDNEHSNVKLSYDSLKTKLNEVYCELKIFYLALRKNMFNLKLFQVKNKQIENAMKLAEKYVDFTTLVLICELKSDTDLLESYLDKFNESVKFFFSFNFKI